MVGCQTPARRVGWSRRSPIFLANHENYVFDRAINRREADGSTSTVFADLYKQDCFLLETKQGSKRRGEADSGRFSETKRQDAASTASILTAKEKTIHDEGHVSVLKEIHDNLDEAVLHAYGWPDLLTDKPLADRLTVNDEQAEALEQDILSRLVDLNKQRATEEADGHIRWLRPEYQCPGDRQQ